MADGVVFDGFGGDVGAWLRKVGWVISTSDDESFHLAPAEGMASGAVPVVRDWPGADTIYDSHWIKQPEEMAQWIADVGKDEERWQDESDRAFSEVSQKYGLPRVLDAWDALLSSVKPSVAVASPVNNRVGVPTPTDLDSSPPKTLDFSGAEKFYVGGVVKRLGLAGYEPEVMAMLCALTETASKPVRFLDVGANIGLFSVVLKAIFGDSVLVDAYEPTPELANIIKTIARANGLEIGVHEVAVSNQRGLVDFYLSKQTDASNSLNPSFRPHDDPIVVRSETLDALTAELGSGPCIVKIDTETTEPDVLEGGARFIAETRPTLVCEVLPSYTEAQVERFAQAHDFIPIHITSEPNWKGQPVAGDETNRFRDWLLAPDVPSRELQDRFAVWMEAIGSSLTAQT